MALTPVVAARDFEVARFGHGRRAVPSDMAPRP
jgi:hypothetical protein